jgi:acetyl esterase/lipase
MLSRATGTGTSPARTPYGPEPHQIGDLRRAHGPSRGVVMLVHGGFWRARRTLDMTAAAAEELTARGFDTWNVEYRRAGQGDWADTLSDVAAAFDHLGVLADDHGLDPEPVLLLGHSAGGQLAAWCAGRAAAARRAGAAAPRVAVRGLVTAGAALDLAAGARAGTGDGAVADFLGGTPEHVPQRYREADPARRVPIGVPTRCVHSVNDERVPFAQSQRYVTLARAAGDDAGLLPGTGVHTDVIEIGHPDFAIVAEALAELAGREPA